MHPIPTQLQWIPLVDELDAVAVRARVRELGRKVRLERGAIEALATATTEIVLNALVHARGGALCAVVRYQGTKKGVMVVTRDWGPGIVGLQWALVDGHSRGGGLGLGLPSARRLVDDFEIESVPGAGTTVSLTQWAV